MTSTPNTYPDRSARGFSQMRSRSRGNTILFYLFRTGEKFTLLSQPEVDHFKPDFSNLVGTVQNGIYLAKEEA
jgi:hypothetical protein